MMDEAKKIVTQLRLYAKQYADPTSFWKVILGTEEILRDAADCIERLLAELESDERQYGRDAYRVVVDEAMKFEQERDAWQRRAKAVERDINRCCSTCRYYFVFFNGSTPDHDCTNPDGGCSNNYDRWQWRGSFPENGGAEDG